MGNVLTRRVEGDLAAVSSRLEQAVQDHGYGVIGSIDLRAKMRAKGVDFGPECVIFEVCQPQRAQKVLERDLRISTALPCRIAIYERAGGLEIATLRPTTILSVFEQPEVAPEAEQVERDLEKIIEQAARH